MDFNTYKTLYHRMPAKYRKHGDMPTTYEIYDDVDAYIASFRAVANISLVGILAANRITV